MSSVIVVDGRDVSSRGRPKYIDPEQVRRFARMFLDLKDIARLLDVAPYTLYERMSSDSELRDAFEGGRAAGRADLKLWQRNAAEDGKVEMLKWLGQFELGQLPGMAYTNPDERDAAQLRQLGDGSGGALRPVYVPDEVYVRFRRYIAPADEGEVIEGSADEVRE